MQIKFDVFWTKNLGTLYKDNSVDTLGKEAKMNLYSNNKLRNLTYFNFIKKHIENKTYEKEYLENVIGKYLKTERLTQEEYDELYKLL